MPPGQCAPEFIDALATRTSGVAYELVWRVAGTGWIADIYPASAAVAPFSLAPVSAQCHDAVVKATG